MTSPNVPVGSAFPSMEAAREAVTFDLLSRRLSYFAFRASKTITDYRCLLNRAPDSRSTSASSESCPFRVYIAYTKSSDTYVLRKSVEHTCPPSTHENFRLFNSQRFVQAQLRPHIEQNRTEKPRNLANSLLSEKGIGVNYKAAQRARLALCESAQGEESGEIASIKPFLDAVSVGDDGAFVHFERDANKKFQRAFIMPRSCVAIWKLSPRILVADACHFETNIPGHVLGASFLDAARNTVFLAWGVSVDEENDDNWQAFFRFISSGFESSNLDSSKLAIISDRKNGLVPAFQSVFPTGFQYHCIEHLAKDIRAVFNPKVEMLFRSLPPQNKEQHYVSRLLEIQAVDPVAVEYIRGNDPSTWAKWAAPLVDFPKYDNGTSYNTMKSIWGHALEQKKLNYAGFLFHVWKNVMGTLFERRNAIDGQKRYTDYSFGIFSSEEEASRQVFEVLRSTNTTALVDDERVDVEARTCTCLMWEDLKIPCRHAIAFLRYLGLPAEPYIDPMYSIGTYSTAYTGSLKAVSFSSVGMDDTLPPSNLRAAERPRPPGRPSLGKTGVKRKCP